MWQISNTFDREQIRAHIVIIDEGSQLLLSHALLPLRYLMDDGRLIIAGDHHQLPPILNGTPTTLYRSLFV